MTAVAYHGTDQMDFARFDIAAAGMFNIGLFQQYFHRNSSAAKPHVHHSSLILHTSRASAQSVRQNASEIRQRSRRYR